MKDVIVVDDLHSNLLSVTRLTNNRCNVVFSNNQVSVIDGSTGETIFLVEGKEIYIRLFLGYRIFQINDRRNCFIDYEDERIQLWHKRLGHVNYQCLSRN